MAYLRMDFLSDALQKITTISVVIPNDVSEEDRKGNSSYNRGMKTLYLLHGFTGNDTDWICGTNIHTLCKKYNFAVVCPCGDNSFYLDREMTGGKYSTFIGKELVDYTRKTFGFSDRREDTFIGGFSMGGYGAVINGMKYYETFGKIMAFSSALHLDEMADKGEDYRHELFNEAYLREIFGEPGQLRESDRNPKFLIEQIREAGGEIPELYLACGTEDSLIGENRRFRDDLYEKQIPVLYHEQPGAHDWDYWNRELQPAVRWLMK